jgi:MFS transporter, Spinster family, sphingosine-1-phosphate transporter
MVGLLISSPIFAESAKHAKAFHLIAIGLSIWAAAVLGCGLSIGFFTLLLCRMAVGVGEASFVALAAPFIDDVAPPQAKARWLAIFFLCIPSGFALGFLYGGLVASRLGWRAAFFIEATAALPFIILSFNAPAMMDLRGTHSEEDEEEERERQARNRIIGGGGGGGRNNENILLSRLKEAGRDILKLTERPLYLWVVAGMTAYTAVIGTMSYYGPQAATALFALSPRSVDLAFGGLVVCTGVVGTLSGGLLLDKWGSTLRNGASICFLGLALGAVFIILAFALTKTFYTFCLVFAVGQCCIFTTMAPGNAVAMWSVPPGLRPLAMSMSVVMMHIAGDVPAPPLIGLLQNKVQNWRISMAVLASVLILGAVFYFIGVVIAKTAIDFRDIEEIAGGEGGGGREAGGMAGDGDQDVENEDEFLGDFTTSSSGLRNGTGITSAPPGRTTPEQTMLAEGAP